MERFVCALPVLFLLLTLVQPSLPESILGEYDDEFDFDGLPGVQHEFKVSISPGREECFYQMIKRNAQLHVSFQVGLGWRPIYIYLPIYLPIYLFICQLINLSIYLFIHLFINSFDNLSIHSFIYYLLL